MNERFDFDLLCIGSGPAGQRAAVQAAKMGRRTALVEKRAIVGGAALDSGTIASKTFREAVIDFQAGRWDQVGNSRVQSKPTADQLLNRVDRVVKREAEIVEGQVLYGSRCPDWARWLYPRPLPAL